MACARRSGAPGSVSTTRSPNRSSRPSRKSSFIPGRGRPLTNSAPPCSNISSRTTTGVEGIRQSATTPRSNTRRSTHSHGYKPRNRVSTRSGTLQTGPAVEVRPEVRLPGPEHGGRISRRRLHRVLPRRTQDGRDHREDLASRRRELRPLLRVPQPAVGSPDDRLLLAAVHAGTPLQPAGRERG